ncbi:MAG TPA: hypothetical protein VFQ45_14965 [Longimicrobium sp.]|nr:hypothetical protein [Longimicrobium sp.]
MTRILRPLPLLAAVLVAAPLAAQQPSLAVMRHESNAGGGWHRGDVRTTHGVRLSLDYGRIAPWVGVGNTVSASRRVCAVAPCDTSGDAFTAMAGVDYRFGALFVRPGGRDTGSGRQGQRAEVRLLQPYVGGGYGYTLWRDTGAERTYDVHAGVDLFVTRFVAARFEAQALTSGRGSVAIGVRLGS